MRRLPGSILLAAALVGAIVATGALLVRTTHESRSLFRELESLRREQDRLRGEWSALHIELFSLAEHARIDKFARGNLGMVEPGRDLRYVEVRP